MAQSALISWCGAVVDLSKAGAARRNGAASIIFDAAGLIASDGSIMKTPLTLEEVVGNRSTNRRSKAVLESLLQFDQSVAALLARAATTPGDDQPSKIRQAALPALSFRTEVAGDLPLHPAIVKAALARL